MAESKDTEDGTEEGRGLPDGLREAIEGAFAATGKTRDRAQNLVDEFTKRGQDARGTLEGMRLVSRDDMRKLEDNIAALSKRVAELEGKSKPKAKG